MKVRHVTEESAAAGRTGENGSPGISRLLAHSVAAAPAVRLRRALPAHG